VDTTILVDDGSTDDTVRIGKDLGLQVFVHDQNLRVWKKPQQTCYASFEPRSDIV